MMKNYSVAVVGASGAVGEEIIRILEEEKFPIAHFIPLASSASAGQFIEAFGKGWEILELTPQIFEQHKIDLVFFSAGSNVSAEFAPIAARFGAVVIDNTSFFRMQKDIPLVVPEVNPEDIAQWKKTGIIANPNCSTIQMVQVLAPLHQEFGIKRVDVSTYQAVSGAGKRGMEELVMQMQKFFSFELANSEVRAFPHRIALNLIPQIDDFLEDGYTKEENKMIDETQKIMHMNFPISATCVRVPVLRSHSESMSIVFKNKVTAQRARDVLENAPNIVLLDDPSNGVYPMPSIATDTNQTYVGRIREDRYDEHILHLWCVADQLRVGAATNAVRIAQIWIKEN